MIKKLLSLSFLFAALLLHAEDGSRLWMRYQQAGTAQVSLPSSPSATLQVAAQELRDYYKGEKVRLQTDASIGDAQGYHVTAQHGEATIVGGSDVGVLYGAFELLRRQAIQDGGDVDVTSKPRYTLRMLNHWDNLDGSVERGYAGQSIWKWEQIDTVSGSMSAALKARLIQYARANASVGINGVVINNVNASPKMLTREYLRKVEVIANLLRPYGIRVWLSINFASPMALGETSTADPLDASVKAWWKRKAVEVYKLIPDFGGFLVKANSEGQPGPGDYKRSHADGANMLADALAPFNGWVVWRSFVYGANHKGEDRVKQAVSEFKPMDGRFRKNVILQSKNGPLDFQPREPYAPIFDNIKKTPQMAELQITQEYLGQSLHLVYLGTMWKEFFSFVDPDKLVGIAGVANTGDTPGWCGHPFSQANWYCFGRLAWNPNLSSDEIAREWLKQTFTTDRTFVDTMAGVMADSREACVDYMMPLGLHHIFRFDHHYGPEPDGFIAEYPIEWCPVYYHKGDKQGIGFDRTTNGSDAVSQYRKPFSSEYNSLATCPEEYLLWFHHVSWDYKMKNGRTLWENLNTHYNHGVAEVERFCKLWIDMRAYIDFERWKEVGLLMLTQLDNAAEWRDTCLRYFYQLQQ